MRKSKGSRGEISGADQWISRPEGEEYETEPFISPSVPASSSGPVRLTPGWEDVENQNEEFVTNSLLELRAPPVDKYKIVFLILVIHGIGTLMPWNMFITAKTYFVDYKLSQKYTGRNTTEYANNFLQYISLASQIPNVAFNWLNVFVQIGGDLTTRVVWSIVAEVVLFVITVILAMLDTSAYPEAFFWITMTCVVLINTAGGIYQNSVYGIAAKLNYSGAVVLGSNVSGTFTAIIMIVSIALSPSPRTAAIYYFITALFFLLTCFDTYFALPLNKFYRYHELRSAKELERKQRASTHSGTVHRTPYTQILKKCFPQCINVFMVFFVTLAIFPAMHSDVKMSDPNYFLTEKYYSPVTCFLTFNLFAMIGNMFPSFVEWPGPKFLWIPVTMRILFIPFYMLCNYRPQGYERLFFPDAPIGDWGYWAGAVLFGLSSGYYSSLSMIYCGRSVPNEEAPVAGMFGAAFLITGIFFGVNFAFVMPWLISSFKVV